MSHPHDRGLKTTFNQDAENYDRARPTYPEALFDDLVSMTGLGTGAMVLELGCGTGQATVALAMRGYRSRAWSWGKTWRPWRGGTFPRTRK